MTDSKTIAKAILSLYNPNKGDTVSNLKLQKLLYYVQGFNLAKFGKPLFKEKIIAWQYGPVVEEVYHQYKDSGSLGIPLDNIKGDWSIFKTKSQLELFKEVNKVYGQFSAVKLMNLTHVEPPWKTTPMNNEITHDKLVNYFKTRLA